KGKCAERNDGQVPRRAVSHNSRTSVSSFCEAEAESCSWMESGRIGGKTTWTTKSYGRAVSIFVVLDVQFTDAPGFHHFPTCHAVARDGARSA
ncbi:MAG: hypothetical protein ACPGGB_10490, partial [Flavobacteriales bacterium]